MEDGKNMDINSEQKSYSRKNSRDSDKDSLDNYRKIKS